MIRIYRLCKSYLKKPRNLVLLFFYIALCFVSSILSLGIPYISGKFVDYLVISRDSDFIIKYSLLFGLINLGAILLGFLINRVNVLLQTRLGFQLNRDVIAHIQKLPLSFFHGKNLAYLTQRINGDSNALMTFCISAIQNFLTNFVAILLAFSFLYVFNPVVACLMCVLVVIYYLAFIAMRTSLFQKGYEFKEIQSEYFGRLHEQISYIEILKLQAIADLFLTKLNTALNRLLNVALKFQGISYLFSGIDSFIMTIANVVLFILGGTKVIYGELTIGQFTILTSYFSIMMKSVHYFFGLGKTIQDNMVSYYRLQEILQITEEVNGSKRISSINQIVIENLSFSYSEQMPKLFNGACMDFQKGNIYVCMGSNGSGKSTFVKLISGLYSCKFEGDIKFDGVSIRDIDMEHVRRNIMGISEQEPDLIGETICFNLFFKDTLSKEEEAIVYDLLEILGLDDFISNLSDGIYSKVSDSVDSMSGGEKQKLSLLRALAKNPQIIILDEPTSALDIECQEKLRNYLLSLKKDKIILIITHNEKFSHIADKYVYFPITS